MVDQERHNMIVRLADDACMIAGRQAVEIARHTIVMDQANDVIASQRALLEEARDALKLSRERLDRAQDTISRALYELQGCQIDDAEGILAHYLNEARDD